MFTAQIYRVSMCPLVLAVVLPCPHAPWWESLYYLFKTENQIRVSRQYYCKHDTRHRSWSSSRGPTDIKELERDKYIFCVVSVLCGPVWGGQSSNNLWMNLRKPWTPRVHRLSPTMWCVCWGLGVKWAFFLCRVVAQVLKSVWSFISLKAQLSPKSASD